MLRKEERRGRGAVPSEEEIAMSPAMITVALSREVLAALDHYITTQTQAPARTHAELIAEIVSQWAATQGWQGGPADEGLRPEELNASNDS